MIIFFISGTLLLNSRFGCKNATFAVGRNSIFQTDFYEKRRKKKGGEGGKRVFLSFWVCGQMATCLPKHPLSATRAGPHLWLSSPAILLFMNECKRLREDNFAKQKTKVVISGSSEEGSYPDGQLNAWVPSDLDPVGFGWAAPVGGGALWSPKDDSAPSTPAQVRRLHLHHSCSTTFWSAALHGGGAMGNAASVLGGMHRGALH